jgi:UDP-N-acetyl-D-glucosamine dehydrogenase
MEVPNMVLCEQSIDGVEFFDAIDEEIPLLTVIEGRRDGRRLAMLPESIAKRSAVVAVIGLGYVGLPLLMAAGDEGFGLIGIDADSSKIRALREGRSYIADIDNADFVVLEGARFTSDHQALSAADVILVAVPTPLRDGSPDLSLVEAAAEQIAAILRPGQLVILESTTYPGTTQDLVLPILESRGLKHGDDFALAYSPERIDPGGGWSFRKTPKIVAGITPAQTDLAVAFYSTMVDRVVRTSSPREAEMAKLIENTFRQVNIALVNELATIAPAIGVDIWESLEAAATKPFGYMPFWPGPGVGGHCIAIDPTYLSWKVEQRLGFGIGFIEHARSVNNRMPGFVTSRIADTLNQIGRSLQGASVVVLGLTYKAGVNDVRESPALSVLGRLIEAGADCSYHDPYVASTIVGGRRKTDRPRLTVDAGLNEQVELRSVPFDEDLLSNADCVVILTAHPEIDYDKVIAHAPLIFDAVGVTRHKRHDHVVVL